jgi:hypothetical protein
MRSYYVCFLSAFLLAAAAPLLAHHSFAAEFDANKEMKVTGKVTKVEWMNPHAWFYLEAQEVCEGPAASEKNNTWTCTKSVAPGTADWGFELASPNGLMRLGWTRNSMKIGDSLTVEGTRAKVGSRRGNARAVMMPDGKRLFAGSSQGGAQ